MRRLLPWLVLWLLPGVSLPALARDEVDFFAPHQVRVEVTRRGDQWTAEYTFDRTAVAWLFPRTSPTRKGDDAWRARTWTIETAGVRIERRGAFDVLEARRGQVPLKVRLRFTPLAEKLTDDYTPALRFTDGAFIDDSFFTAGFPYLKTPIAGSPQQ